MKLVYSGPQGIIEIVGVGIVKRLEPFDVRDDIAKDLLRNSMYKKAKQVRDDV